jgi:hypothetical protein
MPCRKPRCGCAPVAHATDPEDPQGQNLQRPLDGAVNRNPRHHLRVGEMLRPAAHLPDPLVGRLPHGRKVFNERALEAPTLGTRLGLYQPDGGLHLETAPISREKAIPAPSAHRRVLAPYFFRFVSGPPADLTGRGA